MLFSPDFFLRIGLAAGLAAGIPGAEPLLPGSALESRLAGGETHLYGISLERGTFLRILISQEEVDVVATLRDPEGRVLLRADAMTGLASPEALTVVAEADGTYTLEVASLLSGSSVRASTISAERARSATDEDRLRSAREQEISAADRLLEQPTAEGLEQALETFQKAFEDLEGEGGPSERAGMLYRAGQVHLLRGDGGAGLEAFGKALALYRNDGNQRGVAASLNQIGRCHRLLGEPGPAASALTESLALWESLGLPSQAAPVLNNLGRLYHGLGRLREAREAYAGALESFRREGDRKRETAALLNLSAVEDSLGQPLAAEEAARQALALARGVGDRSQEAEALNKLGTLESTLGEPVAALDSYTAALTILRELGDSRREAAILNNLGNLLIELGSPEEARGLLLTGLERAREAGDRQFEGAALLNLGSAARALGRTAEGMEEHGKALALYRSIGDRAGEAVALRGLGLLALDAGQSAKARDLLGQALAVFEETGQRGEEALTLRGLGETHARLGEAGAAARSFGEARTIQAALGQTGQEALTLQEMARLAHSSHRLAEARGLLEEALARLESLRAEISGDHFRASYFAATREAYEMYVDVLLELHRETGAPELATLAFEATERARARGMLDFLRQARIDLREGDPALLQEERRLRREMNARAALPGAKDGHLESELAALLAQYQIVAARLEASSPRYARLRQPALQMAEIQREALDGGTVLLEYFLAEPRSVLWLVTPESLASFELPGRERIEELARRVHEGLGRPASPDPARRRADLAELGRLLLGPVLDRIPGKRLAIVADGALAYVPFAVLPVPAAGGSGGSVPLIVEHEVVHLPSAAVVRELRRSREGRPRPASTLALLADPVFTTDDPRVRTVGRDTNATEDASRVSGSSFARLPWTRREAEVIAAEAQGRDLLLAVDFRANRDFATGDDLGRYRILHFATHGVLDTERPPLSGLVLSQVDEQGKVRDGYLRLQDVYHLRLSADLVVLSGCETALGKSLRGEGIVGLTRGFFHAGASQVVASLWPVRDRATAELMQRFYHAMLRDRLPASAALRKAQIALWKEASWRDPYFWAGFVLQGDWSIEAP